MENVLKTKALPQLKAIPQFFFKTKELRKPNTIIHDLHDTKMRIEAVENRFDVLTDVDLIESCIYELESLEVRYGYLLKQAKNAGVTHSELMTSNNKE